MVSKKPNPAKVTTHTLPNGIQVLCDPMPFLQSAAISIWLKCGSRDEPNHHNGITHFLEHMVFKGTKKFTQKEISAAFDRVGGSFNAFTSREYVCFYARVQDRHVPMAMEILSDMVTTARLKPKDITMEKKVICEEVRMVEDTPDEALYDHFLMRLFRGHPLSLPIQGTEDSVNSYKPKQIKDYYKKIFTAGNMLVTASGNVDPEKFAKLANRYLGKIPAGNNVHIEKEPNFSPGIYGKARDLEQVQMLMAWKAFPASDRRRRATMLLQNLLGGTASSMLYQRLREKEGLVYNVYASFSPNRDSGLFFIGAGTGKAQAKAAVAATLEEVGKIKRGRFTDEALELARENLVGSMALAMESPSSRMMRLASNAIHLGKIQSPAQVLRELRMVTRQDVIQVAKDIFQEEQFSLGWLGPKGSLPARLAVKDLNHP